MSALRSGSSWTIARWSALVVLAVLMPPGAAVAEETPQERHDRIAAMSPAEKEELRQRHERFCRMDQEQQERLRRLHEQLEKDPDGTQLKQVMRGYYEWLDRLPAHHREELRQLEPAERIKRIKMLLAEQAKHPSPEDREGLQRWLGELADENEPRVLERLSQQQRDEITKMPEPMRRMRVLGLMAREWFTSDPKKPPALDEQKLARLRSYLSEPTRKRLEQKPVIEQWKVVGVWMRGVFTPRASQWRGGRGGPSPQAKEERLAYFFEHVLSEPERARLLAMPPEEMEKKLEELYMQQFRRQGYGWRSGGRGPDRGSPDRQDRGPQDRGPQDQRPQPEYPRGGADRGPFSPQDKGPGQPERQRGDGPPR